MKKAECFNVRKSLNEIREHVVLRLETAKKLQSSAGMPQS